MIDDDFYVGYMPRTGPRLARYLRRLALFLVLAFPVVAAALVGSMGGFSAAAFEYGVEREFEGVVSEGPSPALLVDRPGASRDTLETSAYLLVTLGKFGAADAVAGLQGHRVHLRGSLIYRDDQTMIEVTSGSVEDLGAIHPGPEVASEDLGWVSLTGEIVDSKCFLGVMKPGNLKPHRACAVRCISGGVPPVLLVRDADGIASYTMLVSADGEAVNAQVLDRVAEPVRVEGRLMRRQGLTFLYADPATYRSVP